MFLTNSNFLLYWPWVTNNYIILDRKQKFRRTLLFLRMLWKRKFTEKKIINFRQNSEIFWLMQFFSTLNFFEIFSYQIYVFKAIWVKILSCGISGLGLYSCWNNTLVLLPGFDETSKINKREVLPESLTRAVFSRRKTEARRTEMETKLDSKKYRKNILWIHVSFAETLLHLANAKLLRGESFFKNMLKFYVKISKEKRTKRRTVLNSLWRTHLVIWDF